MCILAVPTWHGTASINLLVSLKLARKDSRLVKPISGNAELNYRSHVHFLLAINFPTGMLVVMRYSFENL